MQRDVGGNSLPVAWLVSRRETIEKISGHINLLNGDWRYFYVPPEDVVRMEFQFPEGGVVPFALDTPYCSEQPVNKIYYMVPDSPWAGRSILVGEENCRALVTLLYMRDKDKPIWEDNQ